MRLLDISFEVPEENLALDEAILDSVEAGAQPDTLRFWESPSLFVVLGSGQRYRETVNMFQCRRDHIPVLRRCSAGGAVLQGAGCLNFALALTYASFPEVANLHGSYAYILGRVQDALRCLGITTHHEGISDLAIESLKVSGNAQRRKRLACMHHGTLLYSVVPGAMKKYLIEPQDRPAYRGDRTHGKFVTVLPVAPEAIRMALRQNFAPHEEVVIPAPEEYQVVQRLVQEKYGQPEWTFRR